MEHVFGKYKPDICFQVALMLVFFRFRGGVDVLPWRSLNLCVKQFSSMRNPTVLVKFGGSDYPYTLSHI